VFEAPLDLWVVPLDVGRRLLLPAAYLAGLPGPLGAYLRRGVDRRLARNRRWLRCDALRAYDLLAAATVCAAGAVQHTEMALSLHRRGFLQRGRGRPRRVVTGFDGDAIRADLRAAVAFLGGAAGG
jgi:hypothetical protein